LEIKNEAIYQIEFFNQQSAVILKYFKNLPLFRSVILSHLDLKRSTSDEEISYPLSRKICN